MSAEGEGEKTTGTQKGGQTVIKKIKEELEAVREQKKECKREYDKLSRKEQGLTNRLEAAYEQKHEKIISTIKDIAGD